MTAFIDTNILVRHLTGDPPDMAGRATRFLAAAGGRELRLVDLVLAEVVYVLEFFYKAREPRSPSPRARSSPSPRFRSTIPPCSYAPSRSTKPTGSTSPTHT